MQSHILLKILATSILAATPAYAALDNYWALDEASETNIPNSVGGGTNGTLLSGATWITDGYADLGLIPQLSASGGYSWSFWSYDEENVGPAAATSSSATATQQTEVTQYASPSSPHVSLSSTEAAAWSISTTRISRASSVNAQFDNFSVQQVPEPTSALLLLGGVALLGARRRRA